MKKCSNCGLVKEDSEFTKNLNGLRSQCKKCTRAYSKKWYMEHKQQVKNYSDKYRKENAEKIVERRINKFNIIKQMLDGLKTPCVKCGEQRKYVIHFHHTNPAEKSFNVTEVFAYPKKIKEIEDEVKLCVCLCANCHEEFHHYYGNVPQHPKEALEEYLKNKER